MEEFDVEIDVGRNEGPRRSIRDVKRIVNAVCESE